MVSNLNPQTKGFFLVCCSYHDNAYLCSRALHIVDQLNISATYKLLEAFFQQQVCDIIIINAMFPCLFESIKKKLRPNYAYFV